MMRTANGLRTVVMALGLSLGVSAFAQDHDHGGMERGSMHESTPHAAPAARAPAPGMRAPSARPVPGVQPIQRNERLDNRFQHGHYYPQRGSVVRELPSGYRPLLYRGNRYYFASGVWYQPGPEGFVVCQPPFGLVINVLPPFYTTLWIGGAPLYYADDVYYQWQPDANGYAVVAPPAGTDDATDNVPDNAAPPAVAPANDLYIYPRSGQSADQQAADRYECDNWSRGQTGLDPTQALAPEQRDQYRRAMSACLEARGYSVR